MSKNQHVEVKLFCFYCEEWFISKEMRYRHHCEHKALGHPMKKSVQLVNCRHCSQSFPNGSMLASHTRLEHRELPRPFACPEPKCSSAFLTSAARKTHLKSHKVDILSGVARDQEFGCKFCPKSFDKFSKVYAHVRQLHAAQIGKNNPGFWDGALAEDNRQHIENDPPGVWTSVGPEETPSDNSAEDNLFQLPVELAGNSLKQFKCRTCDKSFSKSRGRLAHEKRHGENLTTARKKEEEKELAKITKIKNRSYPCSHPDCDKTYKSRKARWLHGKSHQGKKKFGCTYENCQERFDTFLERKEHFREHDRQSREREEAERNLLEEEIYLRGYSAAFQKWVAVFNELRRREALAMLKHELPTL